MKYHLTPLLVLPGLVLVTGLELVASASHMNHRRVYTVAEVQAHLADDPRAWLGRIVRVRGIARACQPSGSPARVLFCRRRPQDLLDPGPVGASDPMPLAWSARGSWLTVLRRVPVLGQLMPAPQRLRWGAEATYRVQIRAVPAGSCTSVPCDEALLLDVAPDSS
jgi:hypothetical protein